MTEQPKKKSYPLQVTPEAIASWPKLHVPDEKFHKYQIGLRFTKEDGMKFLEQFQAMDAENLAEAKVKVKGKRDPKTGKELEVTHGGLPYKLEFDKETGAETGMMTIQFSAKESWKDKQGKENPTKLILQDAKKNPLGASVKVGGGSKVKVAFVPSPYFIDGTRVAGVTFRLVGVQVLELGGGSYSDPFSAEEGRYEAPANEAPATNTEAPSAVQAKGAGDF
jgi:hypothetical protein